MNSDSKRLMLLLAASDLSVQTEMVNELKERHEIKQKEPVPTPDYVDTRNRGKGRNKGLNKRWYNGQR